MEKFITWVKCERGNSGIEYALLAGLSVVLLGGAYAFLGDILFDFFATFIDDINPF